MTQHDNGVQPGDAGSGLPPQQAPPADAGFSWSTAKSSTPPPDQPSTAAPPTLSKFGWPSPTKVSHLPHQRAPQANANTHSPPSAPLTSQPPTPVQPMKPPTGPSSPSVPAPTTSPSYLHTQPSTHRTSAQASTLSSSLLDRAKANDEQALTTLFGQFIPNHEQIMDSQYLGVLGMWGIGTHSFAAVTTQRIASIRVSILGHVHYQDGVLECINSSALAQPSLLGLYLYTAAISFQFSIIGFFFGFLFDPSLAAGLLGAVLAILASLLLLPFTVRLYYRFKKSGLVLWVREGLSIVVFIDRKRMSSAKRFYRLCCDQREERVRMIGQV